VLHSAIGKDLKSSVCFDIALKLGVSNSSQQSRFCEVNGLKTVQEIPFLAEQFKKV
jgi:hypothetical protein